MKAVAGVGLGYVGLSLAVEFGKSFPTIGFDLNAEMVAHYRNCMDAADAREEHDIELVPWERLPVAEAKFDPATLRAAGFNVWRL